MVWSLCNSSSAAIRLLVSSSSSLFSMESAADMLKSLIWLTPPTEPGRKSFPTSGVESLDSKRGVSGGAKRGVTALPDCCIWLRPLLFSCELTSDRCSMSKRVLAVLLCEEEGPPFVEFEQIASSSRSTLRFHCMLRWMGS
eukprot:CAMPEP_0197657528 /NCGR_PEP_ID=MMETSP1338-20131121/44685_1 /TAXON_ID=43686 ORGANISM="Pelagodinium beii, Strain RCC1491" /NCGR_SAMPLE_ID=MMETSP1338 /ASSEMBLY_ACC=CAM_ASM_000754 /LENGTH=140 /DNA_ID=CAMNT_0043233919 /DNA_START=188 /DNA_END=610 /DNA_ORIENTATION=-